jgi:hypothetical protein
MLLKVEVFKRLAHIQTNPTSAEMAANTASRDETSEALFLLL